MSGRWSSFLFIASFASAESHIIFNSSIHLVPCTCVTAGDISGSFLAVLCIRKGTDGMEAGSSRGYKGYMPSAGRAPSRTYARETPRTLALIRSGRSTMVLRADLEVRGREYRWP